MRSLPDVLSGWVLLATMKASLACSRLRVVHGGVRETQVASRSPPLLHQRNLRARPECTQHRQSQRPRQQQQDQDGNSFQLTGSSGASRRHLLAGAVGAPLLQVAGASSAPRAEAMDFVVPLPAQNFRCASGECASAAAAVLEAARGSWPEEFPFTEEDFARYDETADSQFYAEPRFVKHVDDAALEALTAWYSRNLPRGDDVAILDMCSSWVSHFPSNLQAQRVSGLGMNAEELAANPVFNDYVVQDLNEDYKLPFEDSSFDAVVNTVSIDYLTQPLQVMKETSRILKPGGLVALSFSNRLFFTKAVANWLGTNDLEHIYIAGSYMHYAGGFDDPVAEDISPPNNFSIQNVMNNKAKNDPMYVVYARKL